MSDRLPPLTSLRAFDAAARHMSFAKAADELSVTPAALSYQIKSLEEHLGAPLFRRLNRAVELTEAGRMLAAGTEPAFAELHAAWRRVRRRAATPVLNVTAGPAFTAKWLAPRLFAFVQAHPEIDLRFSASLRLMDLDRDDVDIAIRFGLPRREPGLHCRPIMEEWLTPMMHPDLAAAIRRPEDLRMARLIHQDDIDFLRPPVDWPAWFRAADLGDPPEGGPRFSQADHAVDAALSGGGVILGRISLAGQELKDGRLVAPFPLALTTEARYRILCLDSAIDRPEVRAFLDWIGREAQTDTSCRDGRQFVPAGSVAPSAG